MTLVKIQTKPGYYAELAEKKFGYPFGDDGAAKIWLAYHWEAERGHYNIWTSKLWKLWTRLKGERNPYW